MSPLRRVKEDIGENIGLKQFAPSLTYGNVQGNKNYEGI